MVLQKYKIITIQPFTIYHFSVLLAKIHKKTGRIAPASLFSVRYYRLFKKQLCEFIQTTTPSVELVCCAW